MGVDPGLKEANQNRLRRIEGQVRGLQKTLRGVARNLMKNHLHHCAAKALKSRKKEESAAMYNELLELIYAHLR